MTLFYQIVVPYWDNAAIAFLWNRGVASGSHHINPRSVPMTLPETQRWRDRMIAAGLHVNAIRIQYEEK